MTDTERLDWLESHEALINVADTNGKPHIAMHSNVDWMEIVHIYGDTYRDAIDNAAKVMK